MAQQKQKHRQAARNAPLSLPTTPFPNMLLDRIMPTLRDTEWRLLCVIARQTLGWQQEGQRKSRDWLTHSQLKARTGRSSEAVCHAIEMLAAQGLIEVENREGQRIETPQERQRSRGQLFFRLAPHLAPKTEMPVSESEITKAKTTKETGYKKRENRQTVIHRQEAKRPASWTPQSLHDLARSEERRALARRFLRAFQDAGWQAERWAVPPPVVWARDELLVAGLLERFLYEDLEARLDRFFTNNSVWIRRRGYSLNAFITFLTHRPSEDAKASASWMQ